MQDGGRFSTRIPGNMYQHLIIGFPDFACSKISTNFRVGDMYRLSLARHIVQAPVEVLLVDAFGCILTAIQSVDRYISLANTASNGTSNGT
jgi:hypothetical protein